jgi:hypothetical protein
MGKRGVARILALTAVAIAGLAASAWAGNIHGTAHNDVLRGTPHNDIIHGLAGNDRIYGLGGNDKLYGGPGNDRLYGGAGNDVLVGGPGADILDCGGGHDVAYASVSARALSNCEVVHTVTPPPTTTSTPTTTAPTTTTAPALVAEPGQYCGFTDKGESVCFYINAGTPETFTKAHFAVTSDCNPSSRFVVTYDFYDSVPLGADLSWTYSVTSGDVAGTVFSGTADASGRVGQGARQCHDRLPGHDVHLHGRHHLDRQPPAVRAATTGV